MCCETMSVVAEEELRMVEVVKGGTRFSPEAAEAKMEPESLVQVNEGGF